MFFDFVTCVLVICGKKRKDDLMFNLPDMTKLAQAAKEVQDNQAKLEQKKMELLSRIEVKLDKILEELKKR